MENTIYVGKYNVPGNGTIRIEGSNLWVLTKYVGKKEDGSEWVDERITLVCNDGKNSFWPFISKMDRIEAQRLRLALDQALAWTDTKKPAILPENQMVFEA